MISGTFHRFGPAVLVLVTLMLGVLDIVPRGPLGPLGSLGNGGADEESVAAARRDLGAIAREPHPSGSEANAVVREYLKSELEEIGLVVTEQSWGRAGAELSNLVARIPGANSSGALLLIAHYDSVPLSPGAADDGTGCATVLAVARELVLGEPLAQDVLILLTDGEELGMQGARVFRDAHPLMAEVRAAVNIEAIGGAGPLTCFQASLGNAGLVDAWLKSPRCAGSSFAEVVYSLMPNNTDLSVFLGKVPGINFALVGGGNVYHQTYDVAGKVADSSLGHSITAVGSVVRGVAGGQWGEPMEPRNWFAWPIVGGTVWPASSSEWGSVSILSLAAALLALCSRRRGSALGHLGHFLGGMLAAVWAFSVLAIPAFVIGFVFLFFRSGLKGHVSYGEVHGMVALQGAWWAFMLWHRIRAAGNDAAARKTNYGLAACALVVASLAGLAYVHLELGIRPLDALPMRGVTLLAACALLVARHAAGGGRWAVGALLVPAALAFAPFISMLPQIGSRLEWLGAAMGAVLFALFGLLVSPLAVEPEGDRAAAGLGGELAGDLAEH